MQWDDSVNSSPTTTVTISFCKSFSSLSSEALRFGQKCSQNAEFFIGGGGGGTPPPPPPPLFGAIKKIMEKFEKSLVNGYELSSTLVSVWPGQYEL